jgi:hypothetical protein
MSRTKQPPSSAEIDAEIRRLTEQRAQAVLGRLANTRDAALFQPEGEPKRQEATRRKRTTAATIGAV